MELSSFLKKCSKSNTCDERKYFIIFDRYNFVECNTTYNKAREIIQNLMKDDSLYHLKPEHICVKETDHYLCHMDNMSKLRGMGYSKLDI